MLTRHLREHAKTRALTLLWDMGSMSVDCRIAMERGAVEEAMRFLRGEPPRTPVPELEYANAARRRAT